MTSILDFVASILLHFLKFNRRNHQLRLFWGYVSKDGAESLLNFSISFYLSLYLLLFKIYSFLLLKWSLFWIYSKSLLQMKFRFFHFVSIVIRELILVYFFLKWFSKYFLWIQTQPINNEVFFDLFVVWI